MTYYDFLIQTLVETTGESKKTITDFIKDLRKREPNEKLDQEIPPQEVKTLRAALRKGDEDPITKLIRNAVEAFRLKKRGSL